jgi:hypothetical protein
VLLPSSRQKGDVILYVQMVSNLLTLRKLRLHILVDGYCERVQVPEVVRLRRHIVETVFLTVTPARPSSLIIN